MLVLLNQTWPWIIVGVLFIVWGASSLHLNLRQWLKICLSIFFNNFSDPTQKEKKQLRATHLDEAVAGNTGLMLIMIGVVSLILGLIRWLT